MADEVWAEIEEFPDYAVSNLGRVMNVRTNYILRPRDNSYGYSRVALRRDGQTFERYVHRLVAKAFITGWRWGVVVKHSGENGNNHVENLRFRKNDRMGTIRRNPKQPRCRRIRIVETGHVFMTVERCADYIDGDVSSVYRVLRGERTSHKGFTFEYFYEGDEDG